MYMQALWFIVRLSQVSDGMVVCARICGGIKFCVKCGGGNGGGGGEVSDFVGKVFDRTEA
jgi:hypothetical protein